MSDGCVAAADLSLIGGSVSDTADGIQYSGSFARVTLGAGFLTFSPCTITYTNTRTLADVAGTYTLSSEIEGTSLISGSLAAALSLLGLNIGANSIVLNTFLQAFPGDVATASLNLNTLGLPGFVSASGNNTVHTFGNDILVQQVILNFGDTADTALLLAGVNLDVLSSPSLTSSITLLEPDPVGVPEPGTAALALIGFAAAAAHRRFRRK